MTINEKDVKKAQINNNAMEVLKKRYFLRDTSGKVVESAEGLFMRVAKAIAEPDRVLDPSPNVDATVREFYNLMADLEFLPNSPTLMNAGTDAGTLSACFVLPLNDSMEGIMKSAHDAAMVQKFGGGTGFPLSFLRPKGAPIASTHGKACGPIAVLRHLSSVSRLVTQGGKRDGANMAVMAITHPDIEEFISCKQQEGEIHNFNISAAATDDFMRKVEKGAEYDLIDPVTGKSTGKKNAREVFDKIIAGAWRNGEPGLIFIDRVNRDNPTPQLGNFDATNPCGEQPLLAFESCNLGSIVLSRMVKGRSRKNVSEPDVEMDWEKLRKTVKTTVHFLDNVIDANRYSIPEIERMTKGTRKIGLGVMGFADLLVMLRVSYDSAEGVELGRRLMRFIRDEADKESIELAKTRGAFPDYEESRLKKNGVPAIRNACRLTVAPTGTIAMIAGASGGVEPIFALAYRKHNILEGQTLYYVDPYFEQVAKEEGFYSEDLLEYISNGGSIQSRKDVPAWVKRVFVTASDISPEYHVRMQAAFQESTDAAISKTINFSNTATEQDVRDAYTMAFKLGCKGITVYRAGSREAEVLTAGHSAQKPTQSTMIVEKVPVVDQGVLRPRSRPAVMNAIVERVRTSHGNLFVTVSFDKDG
ncbi:MAG: adenosylcobalamin-dependent ribonucleoside-diphosphate reductase, partial [Dehalococcoidia bacterium]|nr:adenosylcobalamin-dependent ribonucleoside-diphosphate reductase [Dehalococcoidia bacterium]